MLYSWSRDSSVYIQVVKICTWLVSRSAQLITDAQMYEWIGVQLIQEGSH